MYYHRIVIFGPLNARVERVTDEEARVCSTFPNVVVDPDLEPLLGIPPHYWKLTKGKVVAMSDAEKVVRDQAIAEQGHFGNLKKEHLLETGLIDLRALEYAFSRFRYRVRKIHLLRSLILIIVYALGIATSVFLLKYFNWGIFL